jgi:hypothetical protein
MNRPKVESCVDALALRGCRQVTQVIRQLEAGETLPEVDGLGKEEIAAVLDELKSIMAVYEREQT